MHLHHLNFNRPGIIVATLALYAGFSALIAPSRSFAQTAPAAQGPGAASTPSPDQPKPTVELPAGDGKAIATDYCQDCHKLTNVVKARKTSDDWHDTVQTMMDRGARLPQDKFDILVEYLAKNFGPQDATPSAGTQSGATPPSDSSAAGSAQAPPKPVELPEGDGKAIATEFCQDCHKLTNLTKAHKSTDDWRDTLQTMMDRGARLPQDKVDTLVAYLVKNFGPKTDAAPAGSVPPEAAPALSSTSNH